MKHRIAHFALGLACLLGTAAVAAQNASAPPPVAAGRSIPNVEPVDILKQDQAQRSRDQPGNLAPTYRIVKEGQPQYSSLPAREAGVLIQPHARFPGQQRATTAGEAWREFRNGPMLKIGGWLLIAALAAGAAFYLLRGPIRLQQRRTGRLIERFTAFERVAHWTMAISFLILAGSGLTMAFGKFVLMPVLGHAVFGWLTYALKTLHNFTGPVFALSLLLVFAIFVKDNFPAAADFKWFAAMGGLFGGKHASAGRFNGGEKVWFWFGLVLLGMIITASGVVLDMLVPDFDYTRANMQLTHVIHLAGSLLFTCGALGHIYIGTIGTEGAYEGMRTGYVDDAWAAQHHDLWYEQVNAGTVPRVRTQEGAATVGAAAREAH